MLAKTVTDPSTAITLPIRGRETTHVRIQKLWFEFGKQAIANRLLSVAIFSTIGRSLITTHFLG